MEIAYHSRAEPLFFYEDIFVKEIYLRNGITLHEGACVFDVGANIGLFTLFVHQKFRDISVFAFEPAPPLFEALSLNVAAHGVRAKLFNCGVSNRRGLAKFTFYPNSSGMSSFYADVEEEKEALRGIMLNQLQRGVEGMQQLMKHADDLLEERFQDIEYECQLKPLSDVIAENGVERIDLLKVDVQKSEMDVMEGIRQEDWEKIRQVVIEVHDINDRLRGMTAMLERLGYSIVVEQDEHYESSIIHNIYAVRDRATSGLTREASNKAETHIAGAHERANKQGEALRRQRRFMQTRKG